MTREQDQVLTPLTAARTRSRPAWVTDELVARWCAWVRQDVTRHSGSAPAPMTALAPYDLSPIAPVPVCAPEDVVSAVAGARQAQRDWAGVSIARRGEVVLAFHDLLLRRQDRVLDLIQWETGKARLHAWLGGHRAAGLVSPAGGRCGTRR